MANARSAINETVHNSLSGCIAGRAYHIRGHMLTSSKYSILVRVRSALTLKHIKAREEEEEEEANAETRHLVGTVCTVKAPPDTREGSRKFGMIFFLCYF